MLGSNKSKRLNIPGPSLFSLPQVGDDSGTIHCFEMKRGEAQTAFSFRFADDAGSSGSVGAGTMLTAVVMGGTTGGSGGGDRIFATQVCCVDPWVM